MRTKTEQILNGEFEYETGNIDFSCSRIEIELHTGSVYEGEFSILADKDKILEGSVTASDYRMHILCPDFCENDAVIRFSYDASFMQPGDVEKGFFYVVSNQGEGYLSYVVSVVQKMPESSMGSIRNLFHFTNLAKSSWDEALTLFYKKEFENVFSGVDKKYLESYKSLSKYPGNEQNMEEFLLHINKKQIVTYTPAAVNFEFENVFKIQAEEVMITKNGWGYTFLRIETEGDFLSTENSFLSGENFLGNYCKPLFYIHPEGLHGGNNYGKIIFSNSYTSFEIRICVKQKHNIQKSVKERRERQRRIVSLMDYYQAFRLKQISSATWLKETSRIVDKMLLSNETDTAARLFQAQILITQNRVNEAKWVLDRAEQLFIKNEENDQNLYAYYLYLTALNSREESYVNKVCKTITGMYHEKPDNHYLAWFLIFLSEEFGKNANAKWSFIREQFYKGLASPLFYIEAFLLMNASPGFLTRLDEFEIQVLNYGAKKRLIGKDLMRQFQYLLEKNREYDKFMLRILKVLYEMYEDNSTLACILSMLIKKNACDKEAFEWYALGVEKNLKITRLYEFYMFSADKSVLMQLPKNIMMYFNYNSSLDYKTNAYLYACVYKYGDKIGDLWQSYRPQIERFVMTEIGREHIDKNLAYLYQNVLNERILTEENADHMAPLLFAHSIMTDAKEMRYVVVKSPYENKEEVYPISNGCATAYLYAADYTISFEDAYKNRYLSGINYITEKLMLPTKLARQIAPYVKNHPGFDEYMMESAGHMGTVDESSISRYERMLQNPDLKEEYHQKLVVMLLNYYYENDDIAKLDELLDETEGSKMEPTKRCEVIRLLVARERNAEAMQWIRDYGMGETDVKTLMKIVNRRISENDNAPDEVLNSMAFTCFKKGKYDSIILKYLVKNFRGMAKDMRDIWHAAEAFDVENSEICERCIEQVLYSGAYVSDLLEMYKSYKQGYVDPNLEHALIAQWSYDYFIKERLISSYLFEQMQKMREVYEWLTVEKLAYVKFYSENVDSLNEEEMETAVIFIRELLNEDIFLPFFMSYMENVPELGIYTDKTFVEYQGIPGSKAVLHYTVETDDGEGGEYCMQEMKDVYGGVFLRSFVLFYGEILKYYIMEENDGKSQLTKSGTIQKSDMTGGDESRYGMLNDIAISKSMQDYETLEELLEEYHKKNYLVENLFKKSQLENSEFC